MDEIKEMFEFLKNKITSIKEKMDTNLAETQTLLGENRYLKEQLKAQEMRLERMEFEMRMNNVIIQGIEDNEETNSTQLKLRIEEILKKA